MYTLMEKTYPYDSYISAQMLDAELIAAQGYDALRLHTISGEYIIWDWCEWMTIHANPQQNRLSDNLLITVKNDLFISFFLLPYQEDV